MELEYLWNWFLDIFNPHGVGFGPYRLSFLEIEAYERRMKQPLKDWEVELIRGLSEMFTIIAGEDVKGDAPANAKNLTSMTDNQGLRSLFMKQGDKKPSKTVKRPPAKPT